MPTTTSDPRRVMITAHTNSSNPRAQRWYGLIICAEFDGAYWPVQHIYSDNAGRIQSAPSTLAGCVKHRNSEAARMGYPVVKGVWKNNGLGMPATLIGSAQS